MSLKAGYLSGDRPDQPPAAVGRSARRGGFRRRRGFLLLLLTPIVLLAVAAFVLALLAAHYQPLISGGSGGGSFPGLPLGAGIRWVNGSPEDLYVPPQRGMFALSSSIVNNGSFPVTIEAVTQLPGSPLIPAGPVLYFVATLHNELQLAPGRELRNLILRPGQEIMIGMPLRTWRCAYRHQNTAVASVLVRERFLTFTQAVALPVIGSGAQVLVNTPGGGRPGDPNTICAAG
jgi:hypothetical protein